MVVQYVQPYGTMADWYQHLIGWQLPSDSWRSTLHSNGAAVSITAV